MGRSWGGGEGRPPSPPCPLPPTSSVTQSFAMREVHRASHTMSLVQSGLGYLQLGQHLHSGPDVHDLERPRWFGAGRAAGLARAPGPSAGRAQWGRPGSARANPASAGRPPGRTDSWARLPPSPDPAGSRSGHPHGPRGPHARCRSVSRALSGDTRRPPQPRAPAGRECSTPPARTRAPGGPEGTGGWSRPGRDLGLRSRLREATCRQ